MKKQRDNIDNCSFNNKNNSISCFSKSQIINMLNKLNKNIKINKNKTKNELYTELLKELNCNNDYCISRYNHIFNEPNIELILKPRLHKGKYGPISNIEINKLMLQFQDKYDDFIYLGTSPLNFKTLFYDEYYNINFKKYQKNKKCIGMVINTEPLPLSGQHWVTLFIDLRKKIPEIKFFDSLGKMPQKEIKDYINYIKNQLDTKVHTSYNKKRYQQNGNQCGIYGIYFIQKNIENDLNQKIFKTYFNDNKMEKIRSEYYNTRL
jgi:hypothetical protein